MEKEIKKATFILVAEEIDQCERFIEQMKNEGRFVSERLSENKRRKIVEYTK